MTPEEYTMHAKLLADNPMFKEIFQAIDDGLKAKTVQADLANAGELMALAATTQVVEQIRDFIQSCINDASVKDYHETLKQNQF